MIVSEPSGVMVRLFVGVLPASSAMMIGKLPAVAAGSVTAKAALVVSPRMVSPYTAVVAVLTRRSVGCVRFNRPRAVVVSAAMLVRLLFTG